MGKTAAMQCYLQDSGVLSKEETRWLLQLLPIQYLMTQSRKEKRTGFDAWLKMELNLLMQETVSSLPKKW